MAKNKPEKTYRAGLIKATMWKNDHGYSVTIIKSYKDDKGEWQETHSFSVQDLPVIEKLMKKCFDFVCIEE